MRITDSTVATCSIRGGWVSRSSPYPPASCTISVKFAPTTTGTQNATLTTSATTGGTVTATLGGPGLNPASLQISPDHYAFAATPRGSTTGPTQTFTVTNGGDVASPTLALATITGTGASQFTITSDGCQSTQVGPAPASCAIVVQFTPTTTGSPSATLNINTTSSTVIMTPLTGTVTPTWTQEALSLTLQPLAAVWAADTSHVYAVGQNGTIVYRDPTSAWSLRTLNATSPLPSLASVSGVSSTEVYVAGSGIFSSNNNSTWSTWEAGSYTGVYITSDGTIWGSYNTGKASGVYRFVGSSGWTEVENAIGLGAAAPTTAPSF